MCLAVPDVLTLLRYNRRAAVLDIPHRLFKEPDLDNEATAVAFLPAIDQHGEFADLPLALRPPRTMGRRLRQWLSSYLAQ